MFRFGVQVLIFVLAVVAAAAIVVGLIDAAMPLAIGAEILGPASGAPVATAAADAVSVPIGDWLAGASAYLGEALAALALLMLRRLPSQLVALLQTLRVEQLLEKAIQYGVNSVAGASTGRVMTITVGNKVLAEAMRYAADRAPASIIRWIGGPERLAEMIWARLELDSVASRDDDALLLAGQVAEDRLIARGIDP